MYSTTCSQQYYSTCSVVSVCKMYANIPQLLQLVVDKINPIGHIYIYKNNIYNIDMYIYRYNIYNIDMYISLNIIENPSN